MNDLHDVACPQCGYDGPHPVIANEGDALVVECGECTSEFIHGLGDNDE